MGEVVCEIGQLKKEANSKYIGYIYMTLYNWGAFDHAFHAPWAQLVTTIYTPGSKHYLRLPSSFKQNYGVLHIMCVTRSVVVKGNFSTPIYMYS